MLQAMGPEQVEADVPGSRGWQAELTAFTLFRLLAVFFCDPELPLGVNFSSTPPTAFRLLHSKLLVGGEGLAAWVIADEAAKLCGTEEDQGLGTDAAGAGCG